MIAFLTVTTLPAPTFKAKLEPFTFSQVTLTHGTFADQATSARSFYLAVSEDSLLHGFRLRAGLPAPGKPMGGWYDPEGFAGAHPFGQFVSALSRMYASTGDKRFKDKVARLVTGFKETLSPDGYFYSSKKVEKEWPCYLYDKNCIGMRDAYTLTGNEEALSVLSRMTDWAEVHLPRRSDEWYTLPENLYNCYALTGEPRYLKMAKEFDYSTGFYDSFAKGKNGFDPKLHAYSHVNTLCSAAKTYEVTGEKKYLKAVETAWQFLTQTQMYASGGWGPDEHFVEEGKGKLAAYLESTGQGYETICGSFANTNLDRYLLRFTADSRYGDNMERVLYNGILASLPPLQDGHSFYYSDYRPGATKIRRAEPWTCCSGTYAQVTADYPLDIYFHDDQSLWVNLYIPSKVEWSAKGEAISIEQATSYPEKPTTRLTVRTKKTTKFGLNLRVPGWAQGSLSVGINGRPADVSVSNGFAQLTRSWKNGDTVTLTLPNTLRFEPIDPLTPNLVALMRGPLLMVAVAPGKVELEGDVAHPATWIFPASNGLDLVSRPEGITFRPFYKITTENYTTYCKVVDRGSK